MAEVDCDFLSGGGEMGALMRAIDWSRTPLGPAHTWPTSLRTVLSILLTSQHPIFVWWGRDLVQFYNDGYRPILGSRKHPAAMGQNGRECWAEIWDVIEPMIEQVLGGGSTYIRDGLLCLDRHGFLEECYFDYAYSPIRDETGSVAGIFVACSETTGRVIGERRLQALGELGAQAAGAHSPEAACLSAAEVLARSRSDVPFALLYLLDDDGSVAWLQAGVGLPAGDPRAPHKISLDRAFTNAWPLREALEREVEVECEGLAVEGGVWPEACRRALVLPLQGSAGSDPYGFLVAGVSPRLALDDPYRSFLRLAAGHVASAVRNARAHAEERRRAEALAELDRAKTTFFSNVSHEFRTPLTLMLGPLEDSLSDRELPLPAAHRDRLERVRRNGRRLQKLVNALLDFSRIEAGRVQAAYVPTDVAALTVDLVSTFRSAIEKAGLELSVECPPLDRSAYVDREMWEKIVLNLLSNALKFTFQGRIAVTLRRAGQTFELSVQDTGIGIPAMQLPHVFDRFRRVEGARSRTYEGTGIGLAVVHELVKLHGGAVRVESEPGRGSTFTVSIPDGRAHLPPEQVQEDGTQSASALGWAPYVEEAELWVAPTTPVEHAGQTLGKRIVWADDNADMREYVARLLSTRYQVEAVADGEMALAAVRRQRPDLVLADVMMPRMDGVDLVRALRADPATRTLPVLLLTARADEESSIEGMDAGADDYLYKPFTARDLLARVSARLELSGLQQKLEAERVALAEMFAQTPIPTAVLKGSDLVFDMANPAYAEVVGGRDVVGRPLLAALPELEGQDFDRLLREVMRSGRAHVGREMPARLARKGVIEDVYFDFIYAPLRDGEGAVEGVMVIAIDVTDQVLARQKVERLAAAAREELSERKRAEAALQASERQYRTLFETIDEGFSVIQVLFDAGGRAVDYRFLEANPAFERHTGLVGAVGRTAKELVPQLDAFWFDTYGTVAQSGEAVRFESHAAAMERWFDVYCSRVGLAEEHKVAIVFDDITERKRAEIALRASEEAAKEADRRKDEFIATLSHELRNPLAPLVNALEVLRRGEGMPPAQVREVMERQVNHLVRLVDDLLDISRITRGTFELRRERVAVEAVVRNAVETSEPLIQAAGHRLHVALPAEPLWLDGDPVRLAQIVANLLNNAAKYTDGAGEIWIEARRAGAQALVEVRDTGIGIRPEALPRLFRMFTRGDPASGRNQGGLGIGLALARQLAHMHGGTLEARSDGPGRGSAFTLRLPLSAAVQQPFTSARHDTPNPVYAQARVLVVDDNRDAADSLGMILQLMGVDVRIARDGPEALEAFAAYRPTLVLLDIGMPGMDGYEVARRLRSQFPGDGAAIVALTGWGQETDRARTREAGFDHHLTKPTGMAELHELLRDLERRSAAA